MKRGLLFLIAALAISFAANAQGINDTRHAIGVRGGWGAEISYQGYVAPESRIEGTLGINRYGFSVEGMYQWMNDITSDAPGEFKWYPGVGAGLGIWNRSEGDTEYKAFTAGILGQIGIEYSFAKAPIMLSLDYRPGFYLVPEFCFDWSGMALGIRYCF